MTTALTAPTLPGLLPDRETLALATSFSVVEENGVASIDRMPTRVEREQMTKRVHDIDRALTPIMKEPALREQARVFIAQMLSGYGISRADKAGTQTIDVYVAYLEKMPLFAIRAAADDFMNHRVRDVDPRTKHETIIGLDFPPSAARVGLVAERHVNGLWLERVKFARVLRANKLTREPVSEDQRQRMLQMFSDLKADLVAHAAEIDADDNARRELRRQCRAAEDFARRCRVIRAEYAHHKLEPVFVGGMLVSLEVAERLTTPRHARFVETKPAAPLPQTFGEVAQRVTDNLAPEFGR